jgi:hypothetical protein
MNECHKAIYERIRQFSIDVGDEQLSFAERLARENGWTDCYAERVIAEYKRFMFLAVAAGHPVTPSDQVDQAWHLHLTYARSYWGPWCGQVLQTQVHHNPTKGGSTEGSKFYEWYEHTRRSYQQFFGDAPPSDIWPHPSIRFGEDVHFQRVNLKRNWIIPKLSSCNGVLASCFLLAPLFGGGFFLFAENDSDAKRWILVAIIAVVVWYFFRSKKKDDNRTDPGKPGGGGRSDGGASRGDGGGGSTGACGRSGCGGCARSGCGGGGGGGGGGCAGGGGACGGCCGG